MLVRTLMTGPAVVGCWQIYVIDDVGVRFDPHASFAGQRNGLCGAAAPGMLFLRTGLHSGDVGFAVELHDATPPLDEAWQEVVEASFTTASAGPELLCWEGADSWDLDLPAGEYRVRYCGTLMDEAHEVDTLLDDEGVVDSYLLQFWPAPAEPDAVLKQTSEVAGSWHGCARELPPPPTPEEIAGKLRRQAEAEREQAERREREDLLRRWAGRLPSPRLREVRGNVAGLLKLDRDLLDAIEALDADSQRAVARWAAHQAYRHAGLDTVPWIAAALAALDHGRPLPSPFDDRLRTWSRLRADPQVPHSLVTSLDGARNNLHQQSMAIPALFGAVEADPLRAAFNALYAAAVTYGPQHSTLFAELDSAFPAVPAHRPASADRIAALRDLDRAQQNDPGAPLPARHIAPVTASLQVVRKDDAASRERPSGGLPSGAGDQP